MNPKGWPLVKLGSIADIKGGKRLPKGADFADVGHPYIRARDIRNGHVTFDDPVYVDNYVRSKIKRYTVEEGDICITIVGINIGDVGIIPRFLRNANLTENAAKVTNLIGCDPAYLNIYLQTSGIKEQMQLLASGAAQDKLGLYKIKLLDVYLPELPLQRKIAAILTAYDDLIETNKRRIALLEKMAEELYREWFVRMRFPGHQNTRFVKGVPEGWEIRQLCECADINPSNLGRNDRPEIIHYVDIGSVMTNDIGDIHTLPLSEAPGRAKRRVRHGDIIWSSVRPANRSYCVTTHPYPHKFVQKVPIV